MFSKIIYPFLIDIKMAKKTNNVMVSNDSVDIELRRILSFLNIEVKEYARYVIETRALPNIMDGLRIGARKILWAALTGDLKTSSKLKLPALIGDTLKTHYNHGDASLMNTIVQLCSTHLMKYKPLEVIGQIGDLRSPDCDTAPRYLHVKKTKYIDFYKTDWELLENVIDDGEKVEPKYFLPIIPLTLLYRTNSPGFGFSFRSFSYNLDSVIDNCIKSLNEGSCSIGDDLIPLIPEVDGIKPENMIYNANKNTWYNVGEYFMNYDTDILMIKDLPYNVSFESYEEHLHSLVEKNYIVSFKDLSIDGKIQYNIQFAKGRLKLLSESDKWKFFKTMKLFSKIIKDTLNVLDTNGKTILTLNTPYELIDTFIQKRLTFYYKRKTRTINVINEEIFKLKEIMTFILLVNSEDIVLNKRSMDDILKDLKKFQLSERVLKINISKLSKTEVDELQEEIDNLNSQLEYIQKTSEKEMFMIDLVNFKQKYSTIYKK